jgi:hypothetical protein
MREPEAQVERLAVAVAGVVQVTALTAEMVAQAVPAE